MICIVQRVRSARVTVDEKTVGEIATGLAVLGSVVKDDTDADLAWVAQKLAGLRVFPSEKGGYDIDVRTVGGAILLVSNFTVSADTASGRRPGFSAAMPPDQARPTFERFVQLVRDQGVTVATGEFGADMLVTIENDGPLTLIVDSKRK